jgi:hypothetical protein
VKLGTGIWVWMDRATDSDLLEWSRLSRRNRSRVDLADSEVQDYTDQRMDAFRVHTDVVFLGDLERVAFGWAEGNVQGDLLEAPHTSQHLFSGS